MSMTDAAPTPARLHRLLGYLAQDPGNLRLLADAAGAAFEAGELAQSDSLIERHGALAPLPVALRNLKGLIAIGEQRYDAAKALFQDLLRERPDDAGVKFNLAWCAAMTGDYQAASAYLDEEAMAVSPRGPSLKIRMLHQLGQLDKALAWGPRLVERHPTDQELVGALAAVALDAENPQLAAYYAKRAGEQHDGLTALGLLELNDSRVEAADALFDRALADVSQDPRALLGKGLVCLARGQALVGAGLIDQAAGLFGTHLGSWVAAGWAYLIAGDRAASRARFDTALGLDDTFAETHGALAVLDLLEGKPEDAQRRMKIALRLDRKCFSAALAKTLMLSAGGDPGAAGRVRDIALNTPIGPGGRTLAEVLVGFGLGSRTLH